MSEGVSFPSPSTCSGGRDGLRLLVPRPQRAEKTGGQLLPGER